METSFTVLVYVLIFLPVILGFVATVLGHPRIGNYLLGMGFGASLMNVLFITLGGVQ